MRKLDCEKLEAESKLLDEELHHRFNHSRSSKTMADQLEMELLNIAELSSVINNISLLATTNLPNPEEKLIIDNQNSSSVKTGCDFDLNRIQAELNNIEEFLSSFNEKLSEKNAEMFEKAANIEEMSKQFENDLQSMNDVVEGCTQQIEGLKIFLINSKEKLEDIKNLEREKQGILNDLTEKVDALGETVNILKQINI